MNCPNCGQKTHGGYCDCMIVNSKFKGAWWNQKAVHSTDTSRSEVSEPEEDPYVFDNATSHYFCRGCGNNYLTKTHKVDCRYISPTQKVQRGVENKPTAEKTPQELLCDLYAEIVRIANAADSKSYDRIYYNGVILGMEYAIETVGVEIEGVPARKDIPILIDEIERLLAENMRYRDALKRIADGETDSAGNTIQVAEEALRNG